MQPYTNYYRQRRRRNQPEYQQPAVQDAYAQTNAAEIMRQRQLAQELQQQAIMQQQAQYQQAQQDAVMTNPRPVSAVDELSAYKTVFSGEIMPGVGKQKSAYSELFR
jgi:hypothetical protein